MIRIRRTIQFQEPGEEEWVYPKNSQYRVDNKLSTEKEMVLVLKAEGVNVRVIKQKREKEK